jgi:NDP-sugar pyrophosphorylase family protein
MQILVPLAGASPFFKPDDYLFPKPLIEVGGTPMIERVIANLQQIGPDVRFIFVVRQEDVARFSLDRTLRIASDHNCDVVTLEKPTMGALCSCLMAVDHLDETKPLIIANGDQVIEAELRSIVAGFVDGGAAAGVITFESLHPRWSYVQLDQAGHVVQAAEKTVLSRNAICGFYFFRSASDFTDAAMRCIETKNDVDGNYYVAPALNQVLLGGGRVAHHAVPANSYFSFYSPAKIQEFEENRLVRRLQVSVASSAAKVNVVIPAAGQGSRFVAAGYAKPKPFIDVLNRPMIERVISNVAPRKSQVSMLLRREHIDAEAAVVARLASSGHRILPVDRLTEGTACTVLLGRSVIDNDGALLIANSDQLVDFDVNDFVDDCMSRGLDGSILVFDDPARDPKWSFARLNEKQLVVEVAEKKPISNLATVGIYYFAHGSDFVRGAIDMIARNDRVNGEFYTCPIYNYLIAAGLSIGVYEVPAGAMHGLGTPADLDAFIASPHAMARF